MNPSLPRPFQALAGANLAAQAAEQISLAAVPMVAVMALGAGPGQVGLLGTVQSLPFLLLSIPLGLWVDRHSRQHLMVVAEVLRALSLAGMAWALWADHLSLALLAVLGFAGASGTVGFSVAAPALVPSLVPREMLGQANSRLELARSAAFAAGPALAGAMVAWAGAGSAFAVATGLSVMALLVLATLHEPPRAAMPARHPWADLKEGAQGVGITLASYGVGMVLGALAAPRILAAMRYGHVVVVGPICSVLASATMVATLMWPSGALACTSFFLFGVGPILWTISSTTLRQTVTPNAMLGRVSAIFLAVNTGARPLGAALGGLVGEHWGEPACLALSLLCFAVQAAVILASPVRRLQSLPAHAP